jgi:hypothetical protein
MDFLELKHSFVKIWLSHELEKIPSWLQRLRGTKID